MYALSLCHYGSILRRCGRVDDSIEYFAQAFEAASDSDNPYVEINAAANVLFARSVSGGRDSSELIKITAMAADRGLMFLSHKATLFAALLEIMEGHRSDARALLQVCIPEQVRLGHISLLVQESVAYPALSDLFGTDSWDLDEVKSKAGRLTKGPSIANAGHSVAGAAQPILPLTPREHEVLALMAEGARNGEIAERLYLSVATVKTHVNHIFAKLGVTDRVHAVLIYREQESRTLDGSTQPATGNPPWV